MLLKFETRLLQSFSPEAYESWDELLDMLIMLAMDALMNCVNRDPNAIMKMGRSNPRRTRMAVNRTMRRSHGWRWQRDLHLVKMRNAILKAAKEGTDEEYQEFFTAAEMLNN